MLMSLLLLLGISGSAFGQVEDFYFSHWNMGLDARSLAMGKAGLALTSGSFASALNPAGLTGIKSVEFGLAGSYNHLIQSVDEYNYESRPYGFYTYADFLKITRTSIGFSPEFAAVALPLKINGRMLVFQVNFQRRVPFSMNSESETGFDYRTRYTLSYRENIRTAGSKGFDRVSLSTAFELTRAVSIGVTVSRWSGGADLPMVRTLSYAAQNFYGLDGSWDEVYRNERTFKISGTSVDAGVQMRLGDRFCLGLIYRLGWKAGLEYADYSSFSDGLTGDSGEGSTSGTGEIGFPAGFGFGFSFRILKDLLLAVDYNRTFWTNRTVTNYASADADGHISEPGDYLFPSFVPISTEKQTDSHHFGMGLEYLHEMKKGALFFRQGIFWEAQHLFEDFGRQKRFWGLTMGPGFQVSHFSFNLAAALSFGSHSYARDNIENAPQGNKTEKTTLLILRSSMTFYF